MPYTFLTFAQAKAALAQRLYDATGQFFEDAERGFYIVEALQAFNAFANFFRQEFVFDSEFNVAWYDLTTLTNSLRPFQTTDQSLLNQIEYHLLEPKTSTYPLVWTGSKQFALSDILNAIQQLRDQVLSDTGCTITESLIDAPQGRIFLQDSALSLRRVCWIPAMATSSPGGTGGPGLPLVFYLLFAAASSGSVPATSFGYTPNCLLPADLWGQQAFESGFPQAAPGYPLTYRRSTEPPLSFDVDIQPAIPGKYDVLTVNAGAVLSTAQTTVLPIPDDWTWVAKYGALAQLLGRESAAADPFRSKYADMRYRQGIEAMKAATALIGARIDDVPIIVDSITSGDFYSANWQGTSGQPAALWYAGLNMVALSPIPDGNGPYSVTASVVRNMPIPELDIEFLQIGRDDVNAVLDYAQHVAMFKCGGAEFEATFPLYENFLRHCQIYNSKLRAMSLFLEWLDNRGQEDMRQNPMLQAAKNG